MWCITGNKHYFFSLWQCCRSGFVLEGRVSSWRPGFRAGGQGFDAQSTVLEGRVVGMLDWTMVVAEE